MESTKRVEIGKAIGYGWDSIKKDFWYFIGIVVMYLVITGITNGRDENQASWSLLGLFLSAWMTSGYMKLILSYYDGKKLPFADLFTQIKYFWRVLGATLLIGLIFIGGLILLIVPGIYWALRYRFAINLIIDKDMGITEAMGESARLTKGVKWRLLGFGFVTLGVIILGVICLGIGVLVAIPIVWLADVYIYKNLLGQSSAQPKVEASAEAPASDKEKPAAEKLEDETEK